MFQLQTILIQTVKGQELIEAMVLNGLAYHKNIQGEYVVTHIQSGRLLPLCTCCYPTCDELAVQRLVRVVVRLTDWSKSEEELRLLMPGMRRTVRAIFSHLFKTRSKG